MSRKQSLTLLSLVLLLWGNTYGQELLPAERETTCLSYGGFADPKGLQDPGKGGLVNCSPDTIQYPLAKSTGLAALQLNNASSASAIAQYYDAPANLELNGFLFFAYSNSLPIVNVNCSLYLAGADSLPLGNAVSTVIVAVDSTFGTGTLPELRREVLFPNPIPVSSGQSYLLIVENPSPNNIVIVGNNYNAGDGDEEWLAAVKLTGGWMRSHSTLVGGVPLDGDFLFHPIVGYSIEPRIQAERCYTVGVPHLFEYVGSELQLHRMYSSAAFGGTAGDQFTWDFGDSSPMVQGVNVQHSYATGNTTYTTLLLDTMEGWTGKCISDTTIDLVEGELPVVGFEFFQNSLSVTFVDTSLGTGIGNWMWAFGDGSTSTQQNPNHQYLNQGLFTVCLSVSNACGQVTTCQEIEVFISVDQTQIFSNDLLIFPNPADQQIHLKWEAPKQGEVEIQFYGNKGMLLSKHVWTPSSIESFAVDLEHFSPGLYKAVVVHEGGTLVRTLSVIR